MGGGPPATIHPNTRNIAGMLRYRLLALGVSMNFKDLLGYGCWCTFLIRHDMVKNDIDEKISTSLPRCHMV